MSDGNVTTPKLPSSHVALPAELWVRIVVAGLESDDARVKALIDQGVAEARELFAPGELKLDA